MKKQLYILLAVIFLFGCNKDVKIIDAKTKVSIKKDINVFLSDWHHTASVANYKAYFGKMDNVSVFIGTDATENWSKQQFEDYSKPHFDKGKAWDFKAVERNVYVNSTGNFVWFDEHLLTKRGTFRGSGVVERKDNTWKIKHYVLSVPIPNDNMNEVVKVTRKNDSIFLSRFNN